MFHRFKTGNDIEAAIGWLRKFRRERIKGLDGGKAHFAKAPGQETAAAAVIKHSQDRSIPVELIDYHAGLRSRSPLGVIGIELDVVVVINELLELPIGPLVKAFGE